MRNILSVLLLVALSASGYSQENAKPFDGKNWQAPYTLPAPPGWDIERFVVPPSFAPSITYQGVEDIRFTPGWGKAESPEYWSYGFLWYLDNHQTFNAPILEKNLTGYYSGLFKINSKPGSPDVASLQVVAAIHKTRNRAPGDSRTFSGTVQTKDYMSRQPLTLNLLIHVRYEKGASKTLVFFEVSPKVYTDSVWDSLDQLWKDFRFPEVK